MKVTHFPADQGTNPYQHIVMEGLRAEGVTADAVLDGERNFAQLVLFGDADILHLHWMDSKVTARSLPVALVRFVIMHLSIAIWRLRGKRIVYTIHELSHHERRRLWLDRLNTRLITRWATRCIVHGPSAMGPVQATLGVPADKLAVVLHPSYPDARPKAAPPERTGTQSGPPRRLLFFGLIRPYKNVPALIRAMRDAPPGVALSVCGKPYTDEIRQEVLRAAEGQDRVHLDLRFLSETELAEALAACDIVVLPFTDVFTSGSLIMAMSAGRPVLAPNLGLVGDYVDPSCAYLYDPADPEGLSKTIAMAATDPDLGQKAASVSAMVHQRLDIRKLSKDLIAVYEGVLHGPKGRP